MKKRSLTFLFVAVAFLACAKVDAALSYTVKFAGVEDAKLEGALNASSRLLKHADHSAASMGVLKRRGEADIANFVKVLHALAYYNGRVEYNIDAKSDPVAILFTVHAGPVYPFREFKVVAAANKYAGARFPYDQVTLEMLGITLGKPAYAEDILMAEELLLRIMAEAGFPNASIKDRAVIADQKKKDISVKLEVDSGPRAYFGVTKITGNERVYDAFFYKKIAWCEGAPFNLKDVKKTQEALENSALFSSTSITLGEQDPKTGLIPLEIQVNEAKPRSIAGGISYTTQRGPGALAEWSHRNVCGLGERFNASMNLWRDTQDARVSYLLPDFKKSHQDLLFLAEVEHEDVKAYTETSFSASAVLNKRISKRLKLSYGTMYKYILTRRSDHNGNFHLLKTPFQLRWSTANCLLDPTSGYSINLKITPTVQVKSPHFIYIPATFTGTVYYPLTRDKRLVLAAKGIIGSIIGSSRRTIPPSERFYAGSENTLRGYRYLTVSPLNDKHKPIGGRSMMVLSLETRYRVSEKLGLVGFYEIGNVYSSPVPQFKHEQLQAVGVGLRYYTAIGPLRADVAVPLNKRKKVDNVVQVYMSIGQSF